MPASGANLAQDDACGYQDLNEIKNAYALATAPGSPVDGMFWYDTSGSPYVFKVRFSGSFAAATGINPVGSPLIGTIVPWIGGYFTNGANASYTRALGTDNTVAAVNTYLNASGWYVCDGAAVNNAGSTIWVGASRYLPNLTDARFIMGSTAVGAIGGSSTRAHVHAVEFTDKQTEVWATAYSRLKGGGAGVAADVNHYHLYSFPSANTSAASVTENRPLYLAAFYIVKVF